MNSRERLPEPTPREISLRPFKPLVIISHPGLDRILLALPAFSTGSTTTPYGVFCPLVLDACRVLTNHAGTSRGDFLALDIQGHNRIPVDDAPLTDDCYYFLGPPGVEANRNYPIVKTFSAFTFPPVLPDRWARAAAVLRRQPRSPRIWSPPSERKMSVRVWGRDKRCIITQYPDATQCAHIVPAAEEPWFLVNRMSHHIGSNCLRDAINEPENGITLRPDVQQCFDDCGFVFYPDSASIPGPGCADNDDAGPFVAYFINNGFLYLPDLFHRRRAAIYPSIPVEFLYARFAYSIIGLPRMDDDDLYFDSISEPPRISVLREDLRRWQLGEAERKLAAELSTSDSDTYHQPGTGGVGG